MEDSTDDMFHLMMLIMLNQHLGSKSAIVGYVEVHFSLSITHRISCLNDAVYQGRSKWM